MTAREIRIAIGAARRRRVLNATFEVVRFVVAGSAIGLVTGLVLATIFR